MAKIDVSTIEGYSEMSAEEKLAALEALELPEPDFTGWVKKDALDKTTSEAASYKKQLREKMSAEEEKAEREAEERAALLARVEELEHERTIKTWWSDTKKWWSEKVGAVKKFTTSPSNGSKTWWSDVKKWWKDKVGAVKKFSTGPSNSSKTWWSNVKKWWKGKVGSVASFSVNVKNNASTWWSNVKKWWSAKAGTLSTKLNIKVPTIKVKWDTISALGKTFKYPTSFSIKYAAQGGIFDAGSLIWAGERGPEVLANAGGGKTGVMNVQQMQDAVYEGVYAAVMAAMRSGDEGETPAFNIYLDGRQVTAVVEKRQRERGANILGNAVYSR